MAWGPKKLGKLGALSCLQLFGASVLYYIGLVGVSFFFVSLLFSLICLGLAFLFSLFSAFVCINEMQST